MASQALENNPSIAIREIEKEGSLEAIRGTSCGGLVKIGGHDCDGARKSAKEPCGMVRRVPEDTS